MNDFTAYEVNEIVNFEPSLTVILFVNLFTLTSKSMI